MMKYSRTYNKGRGRRGTALVMGIVIACILMGMVMTIAWSTGIQSQVTASTTELDLGFFVAEAGAQRAM